MLKIKVGRNDKCICGSGKKYKACCLDKPDSAKYIQGHESSEKINTIKSMFELKHPQNVFIDITKYIKDDETYRAYQLHNIQSNIVMLAERTPENESVFSTRIQDPEADVMFMYHGSYRTVYHGRIDYFAKSISNLIDA
jgi:SEC-C motif